MSEPQLFRLDLPKEAIDLIVAGLGELPAKHSHNLLIAISQQITPQLQPPTPPAAAAPSPGPEAEPLPLGPGPSRPKPPP